MKTETAEDFEINYKQHRFSKSIKITLKDRNTVLVTYPYGCPFKSAREFLLNNLEKLKGYKINYKKYNQNHKTKFDSLKIIPCNCLKIEKNKKIVYFYFPENLGFEDDKVQKEFKKALDIANKIEAQFYLPDRLRFLAQKHGFQYNKTALRNQKTRFGSCSYQNNINLNISLMNHDFDVIDYVLIHELVHTKIKNHSEKFWNEVEKHCPDYKTLRKRLKNS